MAYEHGLKKKGRKSGPDTGDITLSLLQTPFGIGNRLCDLLW